MDSPFCDLQELCLELVQSFLTVPKFLFNVVFSMVRSRIMAEANFDPATLSPLQLVGDCYIPALFIVAKDDNFILPSHTEKLFAQYMGDKQKILCEGDHNSVRPR